jgi:hypothetical protein
MVDERYILESLQGMPLTRGQVVLVPYYGGKWCPYAVIKTETGGDVVDGVILTGPYTRITLS